MAKSERDDNLTELQRQLEELQEKIKLQEKEEQEKVPEPPLPVDQQLAMMQREIENLKGQLAPAAAPRGKLLTLPVVDVNERIRLGLETESKNNKTLAAELKMSEDKVKTLMQDLRAQGKVFNMGFDDDQRWVWRVGDDAPGPVLRAAIRQLITERPMTLRDLCNATGARRQKVSGHMIEIQRSDEVVDLSGGDTHAKIYLRISDKIHSAKLAKKLRPESDKKKKG